MDDLPPNPHTSLMPHSRRHLQAGFLAVPPLAVLLALLLAALSALSCTDQKIIEVERPFFEEPPAAAGGVLGWDEAAVNLTTCGNCHVGQQSEFAGTAHADAYDRLAAGEPGACADCHTVNEHGNASEALIGFASTGDARYRDVQCESCHGPGATHVANPDAATKPLASVLVHPIAAAVGGLSPAQDNMDGCAECHGGSHQRIVEEWSQSPHAEVVASPAGNPSCQQCHRGQQVLTAWGENADYKEKSSPEHLPVVCAVCHDPHSNAHPGQLRFPVNTPAIETNLCARCHNRRSSPDPNSTQITPHAPQAALLIGEAGWFPPGLNFEPGQILGTHGTTRNPGLCATCHLPKFQITDPLRPGMLVESTSHLFRPIPCLDANGRPLPFGQECDLAPPTRSYKSCTGGACHGSEQTAFSALTAATARITFLSGQLLGQLQQVDPNLAAAGGEIAGAAPFTVGDGAYFNYSLANFKGSIRGSAVHNPFLIEALLIASIEAVRKEYGVAP